MKRAWTGVVFALMLGACNSKPPEPAGPVKEYTMVGEVVRVNPGDNTATIKHEEIKGWMGAMTMEYPVKDRAELEKLRAGEKIAATVYVAGDNYSIGAIHERK